jgi:hypothetical protein
MSSKPPWVWVVAGAVGIVLLLGFMGSLYSVPPIDRVLNPDARHYWQSEDDYLKELIDFCAESNFVPGGTGNRGADICVEQSIEEAVDRGYLDPSFE